MKSSFWEWAMYDEDDGPDENDKLFDELDKLVESSQDLLEQPEIVNQNIKFRASLEIIDLMMEETEDFHIAQEQDGSWVAVVRYHGINFFHHAGKDIPESWTEILEGTDEDDEDDDDM